MIRKIHGLQQTRKYMRSHYSELTVNLSSVWEPSMLLEYEGHAWKEPSYGLQLISISESNQMRDLAQFQLISHRHMINNCVMRFIIRPSSS
jgi:hypothetical protein